VSEQSFSISVTLKASGGYDAPWIVVYGNNPDEVEQKVGSIANGGLMQTVVEASNAYRAAFAASGVAAGGPAAPAPAPASGGHWSPRQGAAGGHGWASSSGQVSGGKPHPEGEGCESCGTTLTYKEGVSKAGKPYKLWACPNGRARGDGHTSRFVN
jgi:hypothetical protein